MPSPLWIAAAALAGYALMSEEAFASDADPFNRWNALIRRAARKHGVPWRWVKATMIKESSLGRHPAVARGLLMPSDVEGSKSDDGKSWGLMQVTLPTARDMRPGTTVEDLNNPEISVELGTRYLSIQIKRLGLSNREGVIRSYNGGPGYLNSERGRTWTAAYYAQWLKHLDEVLRRNPGPELEV